MHTIIDAHNLSEAEQELIRAAAGNQGMLEVATRAETYGRAVVAGRTKFFDPKNPAVANQYVSLLARLKELDLIHESAIWAAERNRAKGQRTASSSVPACSAPT
jgi:hypothetical protein